MMSSSCSADFSPARGWRLFRADERGAILVEFALVLPLMVLVFALVLESARMLWSYQATISGVRDATRYLARVLPRDVCTSAGSAAAYQNAVTAIVQNSLAGRSVMPGGITVGSVTPSLLCYTGDYRGGSVSVVQVSAVVTIAFPFSRALSAFSDVQPSLTTTVSDMSRVFGA